MAVIAAAGFVVTVIDGANDGVSVWNAIALVLFFVVFYIGLTAVQRQRE
jgi:hypothetical protein